MSILGEYITSITSIPDTSVQAFEALFSSRSLQKHDLFIDSGEQARMIGFLEAGVMRAFYRNEKGVEYNKHFFIAPCFIGGYASLITGRPNQIVQEALTPCVIQEADYTGLEALFEEHRAVERLARKLAEQFFVQKEQREIDLVLLDAEARYDIFRSEFALLEQLIPQYHIASYLGITPTQLSRIRKARR